MKKIDYIVTGTGRSGTVYMARVLTSSGILCGHETIFDYTGLNGAKKRLEEQQYLYLSIASSITIDPKDGTINHIKWNPDVQNIVAESSYMAAPFLKEDLVKDAKIIHAVRNPIKVINSFCNYIYYFGNGQDVSKKDRDVALLYESFIYKFVPELKLDMPQYDRAALYYVRWNQMIENANPHFFFRVEDELDSLMLFLDKPMNKNLFDDRSINTFKKQGANDFNYHQIQSRYILSELLEMAKKYDYDIKSDYFLI